MVRGDRVYVLQKGTTFQYGSEKEREKKKTVGIAGKKKGEKEQKIKKGGDGKPVEGKTEKPEKRITIQMDTKKPIQKRRANLGLI